MAKEIPSAGYTGEIKQKVVEDMRENGQSQSAIALKYGVPRSRVKSWEQIYLKKDLRACTLSVEVEPVLRAVRQDEENRQLKQALALRKEGLQSLTEAYTAQRSLTHEFNNRLAVITSLTQQENLQALSRYLCDIQQTSQNAMLTVYTGNSVIDAVVNQKHRIAVQHEIAVDYDMMSLAGLVLPEAELAVVISNLLDNAIEACAEYTGKRLIGLKVKLHQEQLVLIVTNPSSIVPKKLMDAG